ncbi:hypothetical protein NQ318_001081, partial [Aromia moschata]
MFSKSVAVELAICKCFSTSARRCTSEALNITRKDDYYKNLWVQNDEAKPAGWENALPYEAIPGPKPIPFLGNMWRFFPYIGEYYNAPLQKLHNVLNDQYGNIVNLKGILGRKPLIMIYDTNDMETFLRNAGPFPIRYGMESFIHYRTKTKKDIFNGVGGVLTVQGEEWFKFRSLVNPIMMQPRTAQQYVGSMDIVASQLVENIKHFSSQNADNEMPADFLNELYKWSMESIGLIAFNKRLGCLKLNLEKDSDPAKFIASVVEMFELMYTLEILPPIWKLISTPTWRRYVEILDYLTETATKYINESLNGGVRDDVPEHEMSVLHRLAKIDQKVAFAMVVDMLIAGIDTFISRVKREGCWGAALYLLAKNPEKQARLREEVRRNLPDKNSPVTKDATIKEATRISPVAVAHLRTTVKDLVLGGYRVPRNTDVLSVHIAKPARSQFKDPEKFIPERYLRSANDDYSYKNVHPFASLPFGFGARSCVGKRFANLELEVALPKIIRNFELTWPHEDMVFSAKFLYGIARPLKIRARPLE